MKRKLALVLALSLTLSLAACTPGDTPATKTPGADNPPASQQQTSDPNAPVRGGTLALAVSADAASLLPTEIRNPSDLTYSGILFENLMRFDDDGNPQPYLAKTVTEDVEALTYTIELNQGVKFHDGSALTAEVCKWNLDLYKEKGALSSSFFSLLKSVEVTGEYTVVLHLSAWDSLIPSALARQCGIMASREAYETHGEEYMKSHPVGTGPFRFESWEHDVSMTLTKFEDYWQGEPYLDGVKIYVYTTDLVAQAAMTGGEIQAMFTEDTDVADQLKAAGFDVTLSSIPKQCSTIGFNCNDPEDPFHDGRVRQAVSHAIDRDAITQAVFGDYASATTQYALPGSLYFNDAVDGGSYDPELARQLLADAGYPEGFSTTLTTRDATFAVDICQIIAEQLGKVGIQVKLNILDIASYMLYIGGWEEGMFFHGMGMENGAASQISANFVQGLQSGLGIKSFLHPDELDALIAQARASDSAGAAELFRQAQGMIFDDYCILKAIAVNPCITVTSPKLHDSGLGAVTSTTATLWRAWLET